jgi:hypothetical protein
MLIVKQRRLNDFLKMCGEQLISPEANVDVQHATQSETPTAVPVDNVSVCMVCILIHMIHMDGTLGS